MLSLEVDKRAWSDALVAWTFGAHREGVNGNQDAAKDIQRRTRAILTRLSHADRTKSPSPPGAPPATISGRLAASVLVNRDGDDAIVGPTALASSKNGPYGRFLELGGDHQEHNPSGYMKWVEDGKGYRAKFLQKQPRAYLRPATEDAIHSGDVSRFYYDHWLRAQQEVTA
jgi:hypothetical protein